MSPPERNRPSRPWEAQAAAPMAAEAMAGTLVCYALIALINLVIVHGLLEKKPNYLLFRFKTDSSGYAVVWPASPHGEPSSDPPG